jgi:hypothetical protein
LKNAEAIDKLIIEMKPRHLKITLFLLLQYSCLFGQEAIDWDGVYQIQLVDFQSPTTQIGRGNFYSLYSGSTFDFTFHMSNGEFAFTKNFNSKVNCSFKRNIASLVAPDSARAFEMVNFSRYDFDLVELHARKLRKRLYDEKGAFSNAGFFQPIYDEIQKEYSERHILAARLTDLGHVQQKLKELHQEVLTEIEAYADFCKMCKPPKKKKK